jgi:hypothetical protein
MLWLAALTLALAVPLGSVEGAAAPPLLEPESEQAERFVATGADERARALVCLDSLVREVADDTAERPMAPALESADEHVGDTRADACVRLEWWAFERLTAESRPGEAAEGCALGRCGREALTRCESPSTGERQCELPRAVWRQLRGRPVAFGSAPRGRVVDALAAATVQREQGSVDPPLPGASALGLGRPALRKGAACRRELLPTGPPRARLERPPRCAPVG